MQTGALILKDLAEKLEELGPDYYETNIKTIDEIQIHMVDLDRAIAMFKRDGISMDGLQNLIIRSARLIEAYQAKLQEAELEAEAKEEKKAEEKPKATRRRSTAKNKK